MKKLFSSLALVALGLSASAAPRTAEQALAVARQFISQTPAFRSVGNAQLSLSPAIAAHAKSRNGATETPAYYIINIEGQKGFVVVSGDDRFTPVLGYSSTDNVTAETQLPDGLQYWLSFLSAEMDAAISAGYQPQAKAPATNAYTTSIEPLITTKWNQAEPFNKKIPNYATGCVATGTAQVMNYWKYPEHGVGTHTNGYFPQYSADFANTTYDWANMKDEYGGKYDTAAQVDAVATLMYHLGVATDMRWARPDEGSGTPNMYAGYALINFFSYNKNLYAEQRDCLSLGAWKALIIEQLQTGHPLCYAGMTGGPGAGHFFVLDGYDADTGRFHFNWGWSGAYDGYYSITALEPGTGGIGAGTGSYNYDQQMFVNVQPTTVGEYVAHFDAKSIRPSSQATKNKATFYAESLSHNSINFKGVPGLAVYNADGSLKTFIPSAYNFPAGFNPGSVISGETAFEINLSSLADGTYSVCLATQHENNPDKVFPIRANYANNTYFDMTIAGTSVSFTPKKNDFYIVDNGNPQCVSTGCYQNNVAEFIITVKNQGTTAFFDEVGICIKKTRDSNPQYITVPCSLQPGEEKTVTVRGIVIRDPGSYKAYVCYGDNGEYVNLENYIDIDVQDEANAIQTPAAQDADAPIYTLSGMRVQNAGKLQRGVYIQNNQKFIVK